MKFKLFPVEKIWCSRLNGRPTHSTEITHLSAKHLPNKCWKHILVEPVLALPELQPTFPFDRNVLKAAKAAIATGSANTIISWLPVLEVCKLGVNGYEELGEGVNELARKQPLVERSEEGLRNLCE